MSVPQIINLTRKRGDTCAHEFAITSKSTGAAVNITGYSFLLTVNSTREPTDQSDQVFQLTGTITSASGGLVEFAPSALQADQDPGTYYYDAQLVDGSSRKRTFAEGTYKFTQDITKD